MTFITGDYFSFDLDFMYMEIPRDFIGEKATISDLEKMFPREEIVLMEDKNFLVFGIDNKKNYRYLAHECVYCNELIIGPPEKKYFNTIKDGHTLSGSAGNHYNCKNCGEHLGTDYDAIS